MSRTANESQAHKVNQIRSLQSKGFRVLVRQNKTVLVWRKGEPESEVEFSSLDKAGEVIT